MCGALASSCGRSWLLAKGLTGTWVTMRWVSSEVVAVRAKRQHRSSVTDSTLSDRGLSVTGGSNQSPDKLLAGHESYQRGLQAAGAYGLPLSRLPADAAVLAAGSLQEATFRRHCQPAGQAAAEPGFPEDHRRLWPTVRFIFISD